MRLHTRGKRMKELYKKYHHAIPAIMYFIIYMVWFNYIETHRAAGYRVIHTTIDNKIPFCEFFIVPYLLWFGYVAVTIVYLFFADKEGYYNSFTFLMTGMTVFLIISTLFPNVQHLRPYIMPRDNVFADMVRHLYMVDTPTNLWPSIHVYNSIGVYIAVAHDRRLGSNIYIRRGSFILTTLIILSTMFLKQHSVFDVMTAFIMAAVVYALVYRFDVVVSLREAYKMRRRHRRHHFTFIK